MFFHTDMSVVQFMATVILSGAFFALMELRSRKPEGAC